MEWVEGSTIWLPELGFGNRAMIVKLEVGIPWASTTIKKMVDPISMIKTLR